MRRNRLIPALLTGLAALSLAACSTSTAPQAEESAAAGEGAFPVTVSHAFGETTVAQAPERVATVGWANHEVPLSLDVVPVGMSKATWGDDDGDGILPWVEDALAEQGADTPVLFDETDSVPFEQVADTRPDVILAAYSGLTQEDYDTLSKIAPVVAYPDIAWGTSVDDMIEMNGAALGLQEEADALNEELDDTVAAALGNYPALQDANVLFTSFGGESDPSSVGFYTTVDPRAGFLAEAGLGVPDVVQEASADTDQFWVERSAEQPETFADVDLFISYGSDDPAENERALQELQDDPLLGKIPAIRDGHVAFLGSGPLSASANPSPLSIPWGVDEYFGVLNDALDGNS